jgi:hypothetical protein
VPEVLRVLWKVIVSDRVEAASPDTKEAAWHP